MFKLFAKKNVLEILQKEMVTSGSVNVYPVQFVFDNDRMSPGSTTSPSNSPLTSRTRHLSAVRPSSERIGGWERASLWRPSPRPRRGHPGRLRFTMQTSLMETETIASPSTHREWTAVGMTTGDSFRADRQTQC